MINMCNNRHVTNVLLQVHNPTELISSELHLQASSIFLHSDITSEENKIGKGSNEEAKYNKIQITYHLG